MCEIVWYGERGVINALVTDLTSRDDSAASVCTFLRSIQWAGNGQPAWVEEVCGATFLVEIGLGEFGDPDLILVCRTASGHRHVVFIEGKVVPYLASAMSNNPGMADPGYNSSINGQLTLKYRFASALQRWDRGQSVLTESRELYEAYGQGTDEGGLGDPCRRPRRLAKRAVLEILRCQGMYSLSPGHYHFVAMTFDREPFFKQEPVINQNLLPVFLKPMPDGSGLWNDIKSQVGWIGYSVIDQRLNPGKGYRDALATMVRSQAPSMAPPPAEQLPTIHSVNLRHFQGLTLTLLKRLEEVARRWLGQDSVRRGQGSTSISFGGCVICKLVPQQPGDGEHILLGLSAGLEPGQWCDFSLEGPKSIGHRPFFVLKLPTPPPESLVQNLPLDDVDPDQDALGIADSIFRDLSERLELHPPASGSSREAQG